MSKYVSIRSGATALPEQSVGHFPVDLIISSGVLKAALDHWKVTEHNPQNLSVDVDLGRGYFVLTSMVYHGYSDAVENLVIGGNSSGNPRIDAVIVYVDKAATPDATASNVLKFTIVAGTAAASPVAPSDVEVQSAIGAGNPFIRLAEVLVANGASSITNANITDKRVNAVFEFNEPVLNTPTVESPTVNSPTVDGGTFTNPQTTQSYEAWNNLTDGSTININASLSNKHRVTLGGAGRNLVLQNAVVGQVILIRLQQDASGSRSVNWFSGIAWSGGNPPTLTTTAGKADVIGIVVTSASTYDGFIVGQNVG